MLDVHAPHEKTHSWTDFFIHIATIVLGLLIAIGLEQTVEWMHRRYERRETREELRVERETNQKHFLQDSKRNRQMYVELENDMRVLTFLQQHPGTSASELPGVLIWPDVHDRYAFEAWDSARLSGRLVLLPQQESEEVNHLYMSLQQLEADEVKYSEALKKALEYAFQDEDPAHFTPEQIAMEIHFTEDLLSQRTTYADDMAYISALFPDFAPGGISVREAMQMDHEETNAELKKKYGKAYQYLQRDRDALAEAEKQAEASPKK